MSLNFERGRVNFSGGIFGYFCIFIAKYFRKTLDGGLLILGIDFQKVGRPSNKGVALPHARVWVAWNFILLGMKTEIIMAEFLEKLAFTRRGIRPDVLLKKSHRPKNVEE